MYQWLPASPVFLGYHVVPISELTTAIKQIKELQSLLGKKTIQNELLKEAAEYGRAKKVDTAHVLIPHRWVVSFVCRCLRVSRTQLHPFLRRNDDEKDARPYITYYRRAAYLWLSSDECSAPFHG